MLLLSSGHRGPGLARTRQSAGGRARAVAAPGTAPALRMREIEATPEGLARLARFYREVYVHEFPDPDERESLRNMRHYLSAKAAGWYGRNAYHIVIAELDGAPAGATVCDYLAGPNAGVIEFLFVTAAARGRGLGRALLEETIRLMRADARAAGRGPLFAVVAEMNDPFRRAATPDNLDPFERAVIWGRWGFARLDFPYVQPALSRRQKPVENLALIARLLARPRSGSVAAPWLLEVVGEYMRWAMRIPVPVRNAQFRAMAAALGERRRVALIPLERYVGRDPQQPFHIREIAGPGAALRETPALLGRAIPHAGRVASARQFRQALALRPSRDRRYRLWSLHAAGAPRIAGLASFFALRPCGFGGYVVLDGALRGRGLLRLLVARIEEQMMRDSASAEGWFVECGEESMAPFLHIGFARIDGDYRPPAVGASVAPGGESAGQGGGISARPEPLQLLYKPFGRPCGGQVPAPAFVLECAAAILRHVYGVAAPRRHACHRRLAASLEAAC